MNINITDMAMTHKFGYPPDKQERATKTVLEQAELPRGDWAE